VCKVTIIIETEDTWTDRGGGLIAEFEAESYGFAPGVVKRDGCDRYQEVIIQLFNPDYGHKLAWLGGK